MTRADIVVVILAVALLPFLYMSYWVSSQQGDALRVMVNGKETMTVSLREDQHFTVHGPLGDSVIDIHQGKARFVSSPCRGKQCVHTGWLGQGGEFAACLPNRVSIAVIAEEQRYDSIVF